MSSKYIINYVRRYCVAVRLHSYRKENTPQTFCLQESKVTRAYHQSTYRCMECLEWGTTLAASLKQKQITDFKLRDLLWILDILDIPRLPTFITHLKNLGCFMTELYYSSVHKSISRYFTSLHIYTRINNYRNKLEDWDRENWLIPIKL